MAEATAVSSQKEPVIIQKIGLVDMGSGTIRLVVYGLTDDGELTKLFSEKATNCKLGESVAEHGYIDERAQAFAISAIKAFQTKSEELGVNSLHVAATAAVRETSNRKAFLKAVKVETGIDIDVVKGKEEARCASIGAILGLKKFKKQHITADEGRTSLDVAKIKKEPQMPKSVLLGTAAVTQKWEKAAKYIPNQLGKLGEYPSGRPLHLVGGAWRRMAYAYLKDLGIENPKDVIHGYKVDIDGFLSFAVALENTDAETLIVKHKIPEDRIAHLPSAISFIRHVSAHLQSLLLVFF